MTTATKTVTLFSAIANLNRASAMTRLLNATTRSNVKFVQDESAEMYVGISVAFNRETNSLKVVREGKIVEVTPAGVMTTDIPAYTVTVFVNERSKNNAFSDSVSAKQVGYKFEYDGTTFKPLNRETQLSKLGTSLLGKNDVVDSACATLLTKLKNNNELTDARKEAPAGSIQAEINADKKAKQAAKKAAK